MGSCRRTDCRVGRARFLVDHPQIRCSVRYKTDPRQQAASERCAVLSPALGALRPQTLCRGCGKNIAAGRIHCAQCSIEGATERIADAARLGRLAARTPAALTKQADSQRRHANARSSWDKSSQPAWLTSEVFSPRFRSVDARKHSHALPWRQYAYRSFRRFGWMRRLQPLL